jgi:stearoyl-CoA desaturase (delta-9 desaturase)
VLTVATIFALSAGYNRLFSHHAYEAHPVLRFLLLALGAGAFQNSALTWVADHRRHHAYTDSDLDPYNARRGFWYSHIGWVLRNPEPTLKPIPVPDLDRGRLVVWQHRHYALIGILTGVVFPVLLGFAFGDPWGGFIFGGAVRLLFVYHATFSINSFAHLFGTQPYSDETSARDSLLTALVSMGEGYHNFHHTFPADYRNGIWGCQFDPTKWALRALAAVHLARRLRRTPRLLVVRARLRMDERRMEPFIVAPATRKRMQQMRDAVEASVVRWNELVSRYEAMRSEATHQAKQALRRLRAEIRVAARELRTTYACWRKIVRRPAHAALLGNA